jgi:subtilisin family serine protease
MSPRGARSTFTTVIHRARLGAACVALAIATLVIVPPASGQMPEGSQRPGFETFAGRVVGAGQVLIKLRGHAQPGQIAQEADADRDEPVGGVGARLLHSRSHDTATLIAKLSRRPDVEYVEPNFLVQAGQIAPADPAFGSLWGLQNTGQIVAGSAGFAGADIGAAIAWGTSIGARANVVAVVDTGIDYTHPDLAANIWAAPASFTVTIGGQTITCAAGSHGFNAIAKSCDPRDDNNHGTHVSGTIGAIGNNSVGVVGVNWAASLMGVKFLDSTGNGYVSDAINAIEFAVQAKARLGAGANVRVLSNSWTGGGFSQALLDEINRANASDMLFVAAAGNSASNNDTSPTYPASYAAPNVISVAATDNRDYLASFSNYGRNSVHLGAPGVNVLSTVRGGYGYGSGTSMAAPHVSGAAALTLSVCNLTTAALKSALLNNVDVVLLGWTITGGRVSADRALNGCAAPSPPAAPGGLTVAAATSSQINLAWSDSSGNEDGFAIERCQGSGCANFAPIATVSAGVTSFADNGLAANTTYSFRVRAYNAAGNSGYSNTATATTPAAPTSCSYAISPQSVSLSAPSGSGTVSVTTAPGCAWTAASNASWISVSSSTATGTGTGSVGYSVSRNNGASRTGTMTVAGKTFTVTQAGTGKKK